MIKVIFEGIKSWLKKMFKESGEVVPPPPQPRVIANMISPSGHGKTAFLWAALGQLAKIDRIFKESFTEPSVATKPLLSKLITDVEASELPRTTEETARYEVECHHLPYWGNRLVVVDDRSDKALAPTAEGTLSAVSPSPVLLMLFNPGLFCEQADREKGLGLLGEKLQRWMIESGLANRRRIVGIISQADRIVDLPENVRDHLRSDPLAGFWPGVMNPDPALRDRKDEFFSDAYFKKLEGINQSLRAWLREYPGGDDLLQIAETARFELRLCAVSALGTDPQEGRMLFPWAPRRVLDPFLWAWQLGAG